MEEFSNKNKDWDKPPKKKDLPKALQTFNLQGDRKTNIDLIIQNEKKKTIPYPDKEDKIADLREKITKEYKEQKTEVEKLVDKYKGRGGLPKCERITVVADSEHMGEKIPFCTDAKKKEGSEEPEKKSKKFSYKAVYPNVKIDYKKKSNKIFLLFLYRYYLFGTKIQFGEYMYLLKRKLKFLTEKKK